MKCGGGFVHDATSLHVLNNIGWRQMMFMNLEHINRMSRDDLTVTLKNSSKLDKILPDIVERVMLERPKF